MKTFAVENPIRFEILSVALILAASLAIRLFAAGLVNFDSDEAIQGLMAKHIAEGKAFPLMEYGSSHHGALASYLLAAFYLACGSCSVTQLRFYPIVVWLLAGVPLYLAARRSLGKAAAFFALLMLCFPPEPVFETSVKMWPGQAETQLALCLLAYALIVVQPDAQKPTFFYLLCGFAIGLSAWLTPTAAPGLACIAVFLAYQAGIYHHARWQSMSFLGLGAFLSYAPVILYQFIHAKAGFVQFLAQEVPTRQTFVDVIHNLFFVGYPSLLGFDLSPQAQALPQILGVILYAGLLGGGILAGLKNDRAFFNKRFLFFFLIYVAIYTLLLLQPRWNQSFATSPRYLFPLLPFLSILCGAAVTKIYDNYNILKYGLFAAYFLWILLPYPSRLTLDETTLDRKMAETIQAKGVQFLLTDYWKSYKIVFFTNESLLASPQAGPIVVDRIPFYTDRIFASPSPAYLLVPGIYNGYSPVDRMEEYLKAAKIDYKKERVGDMVLIWDISTKTLPQQTGMLRFGDAR